MTQAHPLHWPQWWPRTEEHNRERAKFGKSSQSDHGWQTRKPLTMTDALSRLTKELGRLGAGDETLSTNVKIRLDGFPRSGQAAPKDPGVAVSAYGGSS